jgi:hypothetical protein
MNVLCARTYPRQASWPLTEVNFHPFTNFTQELLAPGRFIDSNARSIVELAQSVTAGLRGEIDRIVRLYRAVRDGIIYDPYVDLFDQQNYSREQRAGSGSRVLHWQIGTARRCRSGNRRPRAGRLCRCAQSHELTAAMRTHQDRCLPPALVYRPLHRRAAGQGDRRYSVRRFVNELDWKRLNSMAGTIRCSIPLIAKDAVIWSTRAIVELSLTSHLK